MKLLFLFLLGIASFFGKAQEFGGAYASPKNTYLNKLKYGVFVTDLQLNLKSDNTFVFSSCSQITTGKWSSKDGKIYLQCLEKKFIIDSLNNMEKYAKGRICEDSIKYHVKEGDLYREDQINEKTVKFILLKDNADPLK
jgi:hypothetical protein